MAEETPDRRIVLTDGHEPKWPLPCVRCGAGSDKRMDASGFGRQRIVLCRECGQVIEEA